MKFGKRLWFLGLILCLVSAKAFSQAAEKPDQAKKKSTFTKETEQRSYMAVQPMYQAYFLSDSKNFDKIFHKTYFSPVLVGLSSYPVRNLAITFDGGYGFAKGNAIGEDGASSGEKVRLTVIPLQLEASYRFDFWNEQFLVPVIGAGGDYWYYKEDNEFSKDVEGFKYGWHGLAGVGILLDKLDPSSRIALKEYDIENVILEIEARYCSMQTKGLNLSGIGVSAGLLIEF
jgi:hypothetical protein